MKIAFCKFAGLANGGTEKYLQTIAAMYKSKGLIVDFYYTNAAVILQCDWQHPDNDPARIELLKQAGVNLIDIYVEARKGNEWINSNFFNKFNENNYDMLVTAGDGRPEYPYTNLNKIKMIHTVHGVHVFDKPNIIKSVLLCEWQASGWLKNGGNKSKMEIIPPIVRVPSTHTKTLRDKLSIPQEAFVFGLHQAAGVGSTISLEAFAKLETENVYYVILGGSGTHRQYVKDYEIKNVIFLESTSSINDIHDFLDSINAYAHCRADGEVCSAAIIEAMSHGKPVITASGHGPNFGHIEQVPQNYVAHTADQYADMMKTLFNKEEYMAAATNSLSKYESTYKYSLVENKLLGLIK